MRVTKVATRHSTSEMPPVASERMAARSGVGIGGSEQPSSSTSGVWSLPASDRQHGRQVEVPPMLVTRFCWSKRCSCSGVINQSNSWIAPTPQVSKFVHLKSTGASLNRGPSVRRPRIHRRRHRGRNSRKGTCGARRLAAAQALRFRGAWRSQRAQGSSP